MYKQSDINKLNSLKFDIENKNPNTQQQLIFLWETLPRSIWRYYNRSSNGFSNETWTACLVCLNKWEKYKINQSAKPKDLIK